MALSPLQEIRDRIDHAEAVARRIPDEVTLIAVSKQQSVAAIEVLIAEGQEEFAENRVQEAQAKWPALRARYPDLQLHLVGQLQSNKAEEALALFDTIHSLDRPSLVTAAWRTSSAEALEAAAKAVEAAGIEGEWFEGHAIGRAFRFTGPCLTVSTACASGATAWCAATWAGRG